MLYLSITAAFLTLYILRIILFHVQTWYCTFDDHKCIYLSYKKFESLFNIAPGNYQLYNFEERGPCVRYLMEDPGPCYIYFRSYFAWFKVKRLLHAYKKNMINAKRLKYMDKYLNAAKRDLEGFDKKCHEQNFDALKQVVTIKKYII